MGEGVSVTGHQALGCDLAQVEELLALDLSPEFQRYRRPSRAPGAAHAVGIAGNGTFTGILLSARSERVQAK